MPDTTEEDIQASLKLLVVLSKAYRGVTDDVIKDIKTYGLSSTEFGILEVLYSKGKFPIQQIADKILITSGTMTYNIDKLEQKGLLKRIPCKEDRRIIFAELTTAGTELFDQIFPQHTQIIHKMMSGLTKEQKLEAIALLKIIGNKGEITDDNNIA